MNQRHLAAVAFLLSGASCSLPRDGSFTVTFSWVGSPPAEGSAWIHARVEQRDPGPPATVHTLAAAPVVLYTHDAHLSLPKIPDGEDRVVVVELRERQEADSQVLYYGLSGPFATKAGTTQTVTVAMALVPAPGATVSAVSVTSNGGRGVVSSPSVQLRLVTDTGASARISNQLTFPDAWTKSLALGGADAPPDSQAPDEYLASWDLDWGAATPCEDPNACQRFVFVQFVDDQGYRSATVSDVVILDTQPPQIVAAGTSIRLIPPPGCPLATVTKLGSESTAVVQFSLSEEVDGDPAVEATGPEVLRLTKVSRTGFAFTYELATGGSEHAEGRYSIAVTAVDLAGNGATIPLSDPSGGLTLDATPPRPPDVDTPGAVVYQRVPWGFDEKRDGTFTPKTFRIVSTSSAVDSDTAWVLVYDGADPAIAAEVGRAPASQNAFGPVDLIRADRTNVYVSSYDGACNGTAPVRVRDVTWTATLGYKVPGSTFENPLIAGATKAFSTSTLAQDPLSSSEARSAELIGLATVDTHTFAALADGAWTDMTPSGANPSGRARHAMAYDSARGKVVLVGGSEGGAWAAGVAGVPDTWEWDSASGTWTDRTPTGASPPGRYSHAVTYDGARGKIVLFGGWFDGGLGIMASYPLQDTWEWDGASGTWTERTPTGASPPARDSHAMAYDSARGKVVLFGGYGGDAYPLQDTWEWDGASGTWTERTPTDTSPPARAHHAMSYDSARGKVVLFGGDTGTSTLDDTWEWDGASGTWTKRTPSGASPPARARHAMTFDSARAKVVLFAGDTGSSILQDAWEWEGASGTWTERTPAGASPPARSSHAMAYDSARGKVVLFGGDTGAPVQDTWAWDGASGTWTDRTPTGASPPARHSHAMAYDSARGRVVLFGGDTGTPMQDTWEWDGARGAWTNRTPTGGSPPARAMHAMAYDEARGRVLLFGGHTCSGCILQDTWEWDGESGTWTDMAPTGASPPARDSHAMAYDSARGTVVLFGGYGGEFPPKDTWEWDGATGTWTDRTPASPRERFSHAMAYDSARDRVVLFGGAASTFISPLASLLQDTLEWDGTTGTWTSRTPAGSSPPARRSHAMARDGARGKVVLFGGYGGSTYLRDIMEWDGASGTWTDRTPTGVSPPARDSHAMAYDSARGKVVLFGGSRTYSLQDTWEWDGRASGSAGVTLHVPLAAAGIEAEAVAQSLSVVTFAGGVGFPSGIATGGVNVLFWEQGAWTTVATNTDADDAPGLASWTQPSPAAVTTYLLRPALDIAVTPAAASGTALGRIAVDYLEVSLRYRLR
jgi:hypothetical protein